MQKKDDLGRTGSTRRAFLSASAVTAVAAPLLTGTALAGTSPALTRKEPDQELRDLLHHVDAGRIEATVLRLTQFGTRHTASSQIDPVRGIGAATAWVFQQMQAIAATSSGRMTVQQQTFVQSVSSRIPVPTTITNVIATLRGTASPERFYVVTGHLDSRVTDVLNFTSEAPGAARARPAVPPPPVPRHAGVRHRRGGRGGTVRIGVHGRADEGGRRRCPG